jgi:hypothetical protein
MMAAGPPMTMHPVFDQIGVIGEFEGDVGVLLDQQHGDASVTIDGAQDSEGLLHDQRGETERWLVEQQELRPPHGVAHTVPAAVISILRWSARFSTFTSSAEATPYCSII